MPQLEPQVTVPFDFAERCASVFARLEAGEPMTMEYIASELGLDYDVFAICCAAYCVANHRVPVLVDFASAAPLH